jgi:hypothetical protein
MVVRFVYDREKKMITSRDNIIYLFIHFFLVM